MSSASAPLPPHATEPAPGPFCEPDWTELLREIGDEVDGEALARTGPSGPPRVILALSGGADSVFLLDSLRHFVLPSEILAVHVNHQLRGPDSERDEGFCRELCAHWGLPFQALTVRVEPSTGDLERRAREARYSAIGRLALRERIRLVLTAHHRDDLLETLLMRWMRGTRAASFVGMQSNSAYPVSLAGSPRTQQMENRAAPPALRLLRPLLGVGSESIRRRLAESGVPWREDASNASAEFTRNRVRHQLLPLLQSTCGPGVLEDLHRFQASLASHERNLARSEPELGWEPRPGTRRPSWRLQRAELTALAPALVQSSLYRSLLARTGQAPRDLVLRELQQSLTTGGLGNWNLRGGWGLGLETRFLRLKAPAR